MNNVKGWNAFASTYDRYIERAKEGDIIVEVGVLFGKSILHLCDGLRKRGLLGKVEVWAIDPWQLTEHMLPVGWPWRADVEKSGGPFNCYCDSVLGADRELAEAIRVVRARGVQGARLFNDASLTMVMIDSEHTYMGCSQEIHTWWPKIKTGGMLAGDDYGDPTNGYTEKSPFYGVVKAVRDFFPGGVKVDRHTWEVVRKRFM